VTAVETRRIRLTRPSTGGRDGISLTYERPSHARCYRAGAMSSAFHVARAGTRRRITGPPPTPCDASKVAIAGTREAGEHAPLRNSRPRRPPPAAMRQPLRDFPGLA